MDELTFLPCKLRPRGGRSEESHSVVRLRTRRLRRCVEVVLIGDLGDCSEYSVGNVPLQEEAASNGGAEFSESSFHA